MLRQRLASAAILVPVVVAVFLLGVAWIDAFLVLVAALAAWETMGLLAAAEYRGFARYGTGWAAAIVLAGAVPWAWRSTVPGSSLDPVLGVLAVGALVAGVAAFASRDPREGLAAWIATAFGAGYVGLLAFAARVLADAPSAVPGAALGGLGGGREWLVVLVAAVWAYDSFAYGFGRAFGRRRFLTHISPSKTYAGLFGGLLGSVVVSALVMSAIGRLPVEGVVVGIGVGLAAQAGDLAESMLKRAAGAKDSGHLIPGHGGMLDRLDSFLFAAPVLALYLALVAR
ncbi:MAG: phosphatidate cytidylyltransferase [Candidatus Limnocylindrales bacterium]